MNERGFLKNKKNALKKLKKAKDEDLVDQGIIPVLDIINSSENYFSSSSCFGRIVLLEIPSIGDKKNAKFLGKWHRTVDVSDIQYSLKKSKKGQLWLLSQSPIVHISAKKLNDADKMIKLAISCGFKNSALKSLDKNIVVEVCSTERLDAPIGNDGVLFCNKEHLDLLIKISNDIIKKSAIKVSNLEETLRKDLSTYKTTI